MVAFNNTSESKSTPGFKSGFMTSTDTPKLLLPESLEMEPPTASIWLAICSAVRVLVPLSSTFAIKCVTPLFWGLSARRPPRKTAPIATSGKRGRSEEHTSELQSLAYLVCRLLLEKKKKKKKKNQHIHKKESINNSSIATTVMDPE